MAPGELTGSQLHELKMLVRSGKATPDQVALHKAAVALATERLAPVVPKLRRWAETTDLKATTKLVELMDDPRVLRRYGNGTDRDSRIVLHLMRRHRCQPVRARARSGPRARRRRSTASSTRCRSPGLEPPGPEPPGSDERAVGGARDHALLERVA
jgi:hypothetical protein